MVIDWVCILFVVFCLLNWKLCKYFHIDFLMTQQTRLCLGGHRRTSEEACIRIRLRQSNLKRLHVTIVYIIQDFSIGSARKEITTLTILRKDRNCVSNSIIPWALNSLHSQIPRRCEVSCVCSVSKNVGRSRTFP